ncbi:MAG: hypothetical protein ACLU3I_21850 [Acutalibacteraceae bacterium]
MLAIDAKDGVLLLRISGKGYRGVLAVGKDPSRLSIEMATTLGTAGQPRAPSPRRTTAFWP